MATPNNSPSLIPTPKVTAASVAGILVVVLTWLANDVFHLNLPMEFGAGIQVLIMAIVAYFKRDNPLNKP